MKDSKEAPTFSKFYKFDERTGKRLDSVDSDSIRKYGMNKIE